MTTLPIDVSKAPYRAKYITEETLVLNYWIIFGHHADGTVDVSDANQDIFTCVPRATADLIIKARNEFCATIEELICLR